MRHSLRTTSFAAVASFLFLAGQAMADTWNKKTYVTFPHTIELPGQVTLPPGTYTMKLVDSSSNRYVVQVSNRDENKTFALFHTIPTYRDRPADNTILTFYETRGSEPRFIHKWYYPGDTIGREFIYGKDRREYIASLMRSTDLVAMRDTTTTTTTTTENGQMQSEPVVTEEERVAGGGDRQAVDQAVADQAVKDPEMPDDAAEPQPAPQPAEDQAAQPSTPAPAETPTTLPATASELPLVALSGIILLGLGTILRVRRA